MSSLDDTLVIVGVIASILQVEPEFARGARRGEHEAWDSLRHIEIVFQIEDEFHIQFNEDDIAQLQDVNSIIGVVKRYRDR